MEHIYSETLQPGSYETFGFCQDPQYVPRRHKDQHLARKGSRLAKTDCEALIGHYHRPTCESSVGHSVAMVMPECIPARIETMGYFMEAIFYMDNIAESGSQDDTGSLTNEWAETMPGSGDKTTTTTDSQHKVDGKSNTGAKQVVAKLALQLLLTDPDCAKNVMEAWKEWAKGFNKPRRFDSVEQYMQYRVVDSGAIVAVHLMNWAMGLNISVEELRQIEDIVDHAARALSYQNDFFSFNYEHDMFVELGGSSIGIANAVFVLADTEGLDLEEAKKKVARLGQEHENAVLQLKDERWEKVDHKLQVCLDGIVDMVVGNLVWSASSDRYSSHRNEKLRMELPVRRVNHERKESAVQIPVLSPPTPPNDSDHEDDSSELRGRKGKPVDSLEEGMKKLLAQELETPEFSDNAAPALGDELVCAPIKYLESLPSKGFREAIVDGMDGWLHLPKRSITTIKDVVKHVHTASLLCDDMEDSSPLRRGQPSAHTIFGAPQTVNSTSYLWTLALDRLSELPNPQCLRIFIDEVRGMQIGQSWDLYWTQALECPREEEYLAMIDMKTGGLFALLIRLMVAESPRKIEIPDFKSLVSLTGRYFQIRDDLANLISEEYTNQKGWCEDLDEGKYSLPLIHALNNLPRPAKVQLQALLVQRRTAGAMTPEMKALVIKHMKDAGSLDYAKTVALDLQDKVRQELTRLEEAFGQENYVIQLALEKLKLKA